MTDFYQPFSMLRLFKTLNSRAIMNPTLHSLRSLSMGLLRFNLFEVVEKSVQYQTRANAKIHIIEV